MSNRLVTTEELLACLAVSTPGRLRSLLRRQGVKFLEGTHGPVTTLRALEAAMGLALEAPTDDDDASWSVRPRA